VRFLVDESTGRSVAAFLRRAGHDVAFVAELMLGAPDEAVLERALSENRVLVTNDKDFGELVFRRGYPHSGILLLRLQDERPASKVRLMAEVLERVADKLAGKVVVATESGIRVRS
jgi:predicted nuclease of predicted toxin-antitoxin system